MAKFVAQAQALIHLDISGMYMGDEATKRIMIEGVAESKTMAAIHLEENLITHWTRIQIYHTLTKPKVSSDLYFSSKLSKAAEFEMD